MGAGTVLMALKAIGDWVIRNPTVIVGTVDKITKIQAEKKMINNEEHLKIVDEKLNQLGVVALELDQKVDAEMTFVRKQLHIMKIMLCVMGGTLSVAVVVIILLAFFK